MAEPGWVRSNEHDEGLALLLAHCGSGLFALALYQDPVGLVGAAMAGADAVDAHIHAAAGTRDLFAQAAHGAALATTRAVTIGPTTYRVSPGVPVHINGATHPTTHLHSDTSSICAHVVHHRGLIAGFYDSQLGQNRARAHQALATIARALPR